MATRSGRTEPSGPRAAPRPSAGRIDLPRRPSRRTQRLKALLQLNLILSKSQGEKKLKPAEKEEIRSIVKENWGVFTISTRKDFRGYFPSKNWNRSTRSRPFLGGKRGPRAQEPGGRPSSRTRMARDGSGPR